MIELFTPTELQRLRTLDPEGRRREMVYLLAMGVAVGLDVEVEGCTFGHAVMIVAGRRWAALLALSALSGDDPRRADPGLILGGSEPVPMLPPSVPPMVALAALYRAAADVVPKAIDTLCALRGGLQLGLLYRQTAIAWVVADGLPEDPGLLDRVHRSIEEVDADHGAVLREVRLLLDAPGLQ